MEERFTGHIRGPQPHAAPERNGTTESGFTRKRSVEHGSLPNSPWALPNKYTRSPAEKPKIYGLYR